MVDAHRQSVSDSRKSNRYADQNDPCHGSDSELNLSPGTVPVRGTGATDSVEEEFVTCSTEPTGKPGFNLLRTTLEIIELAAIIAMEMMVMFFTGNLVARRVTWNFNRGEPAIFDQCFDVAINGGNPQAFMVSSGDCQGFFQR